MEPVHMEHQVVLHHRKHIQKDIVMNQCYKNQAHIRILVHPMLVEYYGGKVIQFNQSQKKLNHIKQQIKQKKIKVMLCLLNQKKMERKEWMIAIMMTMHLYSKLKLNNLKHLQLIYSTWVIQIHNLLNNQADLVIC